MKYAWKVPHSDEIKILIFFPSNFGNNSRLKKIGFLQVWNMPTLSVNSDEFLHYRGLIFNGILEGKDTSINIQS